ncbi:MAG: hypothetical protein C4581_06260 [Nitrospiraceae bacterium]|nr:MAG: hypothetical protein C4581_06260 [Nitrospiraceae bacterium]
MVSYGYLIQVLSVYYKRKELKKLNYLTEGLTRPGGVAECTGCHTIYAPVKQVQHDLQISGVYAMSV